MYVCDDSKRVITCKNFVQIKSYWSNAAKISIVHKSCNSLLCMIIFHLDFIVF